MKKVITVLAALAATTMLTACATQNERPAAISGQSDVSQIKAQMAKVTDWQLAHMDAATYSIRKPSKQTWIARGWVMGTFFVGLADAADMLKRPDYDKALKDIAITNQWKLGDRLTHADDHLVGQIYARYAQREKKPEYIASTRESFDKIIAHNSQVSLEFIEKPGAESACQERWCWADALFMAPAPWMAVGKASGDERYIQYADKEFWATTDYLYDKEARLFFRDSRFFPQRGPDGEKVYWARGNGWVYGGIVNILRILPKSDPRRARYVKLFQDMSDALVALQQDTGFWHTSLAAKRPEPPETSGTGFFTYGLAYGVNEGILTGEKYKRAARLGWAGLNQHVDVEGRLGYVQQVGDRPGDVQPGDMQFYGVGAYLLAGGQMLKLEGGK
jgi:unsaturated rhamnogalacturonyl hydrolase